MTRSRWVNLLLSGFAAVAAYAGMELAAPHLAAGPTVVEPAAVPTDGLVALQPVHDFGRVDTGRPLTHTFTLTNLTDRPVRVLETKKSCTCTSAELTDEPVPPGGSVPLTLNVDWKGRTGRQQAVAWVRTDYDEQPTQQVVITADAGIKPAVVPGLLTVGERAGELRQVLQVTGGEGRDFRIERVETPPDLRLTRLNDSGEADPSLNLVGGAGRFAVARIEPSGTDGAALQMSDVILFHTNDPGAPVLRVGVSRPGRASR